MRLRAARGAIRVPSDDGDALLGSTERLLSAVLQRNAIDPEDLVSIMFTATEDLRSAFPAEAARRMGLGRVPLHVRPGDPGAGFDAVRDPDPPALPLRPDPRRGRARVPRRRGVPPR